VGLTKASRGDAVDPSEGSEDRTGFAVIFGKARADCGDERRGGVPVAGDDPPEVVTGGGEGGLMGGRGRVALDVTPPSGLVGMGCSVDC